MQVQENGKDHVAASAMRSATAQHHPQGEMARRRDALMQRIRDQLEAELNALRQRQAEELKAVDEAHDVVQCLDGEIEVASARIATAYGFLALGEQPPFAVNAPIPGGISVAIPDPVELEPTPPP